MVASKGGWKGGKGNLTAENAHKGHKRAKSANIVFDAGFDKKDMEKRMEKKEKKERKKKEGGSLINRKRFIARDQHDKEKGDKDRDKEGSQERLETG
tara:strand:+ start:461 stop:751 length:291 start_codon:yes stop_codon:yes gene_type:complete